MPDSLGCFDGQFTGFCNEDAGSLRVRSPLEPDGLLVSASARLLERVSLPVSVRRRLYTLRDQSRRVAANKSGFALIMEATEYADRAADALWFPRLIEAETIGRKCFAVPPTEIAHAEESHANHELDLAQIRHRERRSTATLDELLEKALVQELTSRVLAASEASEMRVRSVLMGG